MSNMHEMKSAVWIGILTIEHRLCPRRKESRTIALGFCTTDSIPESRKEEE